jgi:WhiB family redox-sensing transcriptional regulator
MNAAEHDWRRDAACTSHHPELFFPIGTAGPALAQQERARQICRSCPVRLACLEWAIDVGADHGIWGGLSEQERQSLRRRRRSGRPTGTDLRVVASETALTTRAASRQRTTNAASSLQRHPHATEVPAPTRPSS